MDDYFYIKGSAVLKELALKPGKPYDILDFRNPADRLAVFFLLENGLIIFEKDIVDSDTLAYITPEGNRVNSIGFETFAIELKMAKAEEKAVENREIISNYKIEKRVAMALNFSIAAFILTALCIIYLFMKAH